MADNFENTVKAICAEHGNDRGRMMDIVREVQARFGCVSPQAMDVIACAAATHRVEVESVVSFYAFLSNRPKGHVTIRLCNDIVDRMHGMEQVAAAFEEELGIAVGSTTPDGKITLESTPCIGMCDQPPAALVNDKVMTRLSSDAARRIVRSLKEHGDPERLSHTMGDGNNADPLVRSMVSNNLRVRGEVIFAPFTRGAGLCQAVAMSPVEVIKAIKTARLRGRGGAGFPTGMKWEFARGAEGADKFVICNADEGEPGTFKDRAILTEAPHLVFEGMAIAGYATGADSGIVYLRAEYAYLRPFLERTLAEMRDAKLLGKGVCGKADFDFDIRIQLGAGAYICGEETSLISSCEGLRGDPKNRPPFPAQQGYLGHPTTVNNVETLAAAARILERGSAWFATLGSTGSAGTKVLSVSGDCRIPGVYELPFGTTLRELLTRVGAEDAAAVQVGGPSGQLCGPADFERKICFDDLATGGSIVVFGPKRDILDAVQSYMEFFVEESCGYCTPCRVGNRLLLKGIEKIRSGRGEPEDLAYLEALGATVKLMSRCGLGQTSSNPVLTTLKNFRPQYERSVKKSSDGLQPSFDIKAALVVAESITGRKSEHFRG
ncbi:MAG TPA: NAD(P)H-dependent oxidoreductase subunit E [Polyangia bacterium]|nr:NAD(P)H-dependent oxidoreductase subunit E [Polyangia bacterium]